MNRNLKLVKAIMWAYLALVGIYLTYGYVTGTGLYGWFLDLQLRMFGKGYMEAAAILAFLVFFIPILPVARYLKRKEALPPGQLKQYALSYGQPGMAGDPRTTKKRPEWKWLGVVGILPFLISVGAYVYVTKVDRDDQKRQIYQMDLEKSAELPAPDVKFVELAGVLQEDYQYRLSEDMGASAQISSYMPVTNSTWDTSEPVKYFLYLKSQGDTNVTIGHFDKQTNRYEVMPGKGPFASSFGGELSKGSLPTYVKNAFQRRGISAAEPSFVLTWTGDFQDNRVASAYSGQMYYMIPYFGAFFSMVVLVGGGLSVWLRRKRESRS
ncbi:MAG TPA: hypothetical protein VJX67_12880 [Blastocatellia bacterium]|nr:hypothetical protein [Blastocatellia bacterium]